MKRSPEYQVTGSLKIPDEEIWQWQKDLVEMGFLQPEIDSILAPASQTYADAIHTHSREYIETELAKIAAVAEKEGRSLTDEQKDYLRKTIASRRVREP